MMRRRGQCRYERGIVATFWKDSEQTAVVEMKALEQNEIEAWASV
jgi:hypothetical protein